MGMASTFSPARRAVSALVWVSLAGCAAGGNDGRTLELEAACVEDIESLPPDAWVCPDHLEVECVDGVGNPDSIFVRPPISDGSLECAGIEVAVDDPGPFPLGRHEVVIIGTVEGQEPIEMCRASLLVVDTVEPEVIPHDPAPLWPPNHSMHRVDLDDCIEVHDACDPDVDAWFTWVASDEPADTIGDGNTAPDVRVVSCGEVELRAERQGGADGRVYTLGWMAVDGEGHIVDGTCRIEVPHDQSGEPAVEGPSAYRVDVCP